MRKIVALILIVIVLVVVALWVAQRKPKKCQTASNVPITGSREEGPKAKVEMILNPESKLLSYAIVLNGLKHDVESVHFEADGKDIYQASGPRKVSEEGSEIIIHGLWRESSRVPITSENIETLKAGNMNAVIRFQDQSQTPLRVKLIGQ